MTEYRDLDNPLAVEIEKRMQRTCESGVFTITRGLIDMAGSVGAVLNAVYDRAVVINAELNITVEKAHVSRAYGENLSNKFFSPTTVEWSR